MNKKIQRLQKLAQKASLALGKFEDALEKAKEQRNWKTICEAEGVSPEADVGDWMC